ncbi:glycosyltransferase family 2 protein [Sutcliffiella horikoshii]|uniref:glycosyltransferase family 2 protein n=1 Tax=Sutcliffiella horikoshii TaxID=79883 RepID=UPI001CFD1A4E|nr:glycosyltransferase family 2 protein [Sutcliffiella horikoshii]
MNYTIIEHEEFKEYKSLKNEHELKIEVSIIIPSYNKFPQNLLTLYSLEIQDFDFNRMEVLFIDDCSTDETQSTLNSFNPDFPFRYLRCKKNVGRAKARNLGINESKGDLLIFLDAEMLVRPDFVKQHYLQHFNSCTLQVITGALFFEGIYSCLYPSFTVDQKMQISKKIIKKNELDRRTKSILYHFISDQDITDYIVLLSKKDIMRQKYKGLTFTMHSFGTDLIENFGDDLKSFMFPWMLFLTGNLSLKKELLLNVGLFDESFKFWGYEDWELGYRLSKYGAKFKSSKLLMGYHQEHPVTLNKAFEAAINLKLFLKKYNYEIDLLILILQLTGFATFVEISKCLKDFKRLPVNKYNNIKHLFREVLLELVRQFEMEPTQDTKSFKDKLGFSFKEVEIVELVELKETEQYDTLINLIEGIIQD